MKIYLLLALCFSTVYLCSQAVFAQEKPFVGMHHLSSKPAAEPTPSVKAENSTTPPPENEAAKLPAYPPLAAKDALVKPEDLERWPHMNEVATAHSDADVKKLLHIIESDRGAVPPQGLFLMAKVLADKKMMDQAAVYFFAGQLRLTFDVTRWPPRADADDVKRLSADDKKTEDQAAPNQDDKSPRMINPHTGVTNLANSIGQPIITWALRDPKHLSVILNAVREWDSGAPYAYDPGYDTGEPIPFDKWPRLLEKVRESYFKRMDNLARVMGQVKS